MDTPRHVTSVAHGVVMEVTLWLMFITATTTCQPVQTLDEILHSGEYVFVIIALCIVHRRSRPVVRLDSHRIIRDI
jgi:hypothetical protein